MNPTPAQQKVLDFLYENLPNCVAILGDRQVGKRTIARLVREHYQVVDSDYLFFPSFDAVKAQQLQDFLGYSAVGPFRLAVIRVWGAGSLDAVLTLMEADHSDVRIILLAEPGVLPDSVLSRCEVHHILPPDLEDVRRIVSEKVTSPVLAEKVALTSSGSIPIVSDYVEDQEDKEVVLTAIKAFVNADRASLESLADSWTERHTELLVEWCYEAAAKKWKKFTGEEVECTTYLLPATILLHLRDTVRPRLTVRGSLVNAWEAYHGMD